MIKFIEVDIANDDGKMLINVAQIVKIEKNYDGSRGHISFNSSGDNSNNYIQTKQNYEELKKMILNS